MSTPALVYLGIGSNLQDPHNQVKRAVQKIAALPSTNVLRHSPWYWSTAIGLDNRPAENQPDFINGVIEIETILDPYELLLALQKIELSQGRTREVRWGSRTLDIDILLYGNQQINSDDLDIPHPRIRERNFVLVPLADINPAIPLSMLGCDNLQTGKNETIASLLASLSREGLRRLDEHSIHE